MHTLFGKAKGRAKELTFIMGSGPLKDPAMFDESLRVFFWYKGYISNRDLIAKQSALQPKERS